MQLRITPDELLHVEKEILQKAWKTIPATQQKQVAMLDDWLVDRQFEDPSEEMEPCRTVRQIRQYVRRNVQSLRREYQEDWGPRSENILDYVGDPEDYDSREEWEETAKNDSRRMRCLVALQAATWQIVAHLEDFLLVFFMRYGELTQQTT